MTFAKTLLASAALVASVGASAQVTGSIGGGFGPFLSLETSAPNTACTPGAAICTLEAPLATITSGTIYSINNPAYAAIPAGTVFEDRFLASGPTSDFGPGFTPAVLTFAAGVGYVSFYWGSPDDYNTLTVNTNMGSFSFTPGVGDLAALPTDGNQAFATYVQFVATAGTLIESLSFSSSTDAFETANFSITPIPEPETYALMLAGLAALGFVSKRRKQA